MILDFFLRSNFQVPWSHGKKVFQTKHSLRTCKQLVVAEHDMSFTFHNKIYARTEILKYFIL